MRNLGIAMDFSPSSKAALRWATQNLVRDGDTVTILNVQPKGSPDVAPHIKTMWSNSGTAPFIPLNEFKEPKTQKDYGIPLDTEFISLLDDLNHIKNVTIQVKTYWGDANEKLCEAATTLPLHAIVMGSRGQGVIKRTLLGSVSNHVVNNASCPVTVVKQ